MSTYMLMMALLVLSLAVGGAFTVWYVRKQKARESLLEKGLSDHQRAIVADQVPLIRRLPPELHGKLEGKINLFLNQVEFVGCNGLDVTEEMRLSIAAQACLLVVNRDRWYENLHTILIYPGAFTSRLRHRSGYIISERDVVRTGESWSRGPVVLSWAHTHQDAINDRDGRNVVFHEFAHQIDDQSGRTNGVPSLDPGQDLTEWAHVLVTAYERHRRSVEAGRKTLFNAYGAEGLEEFFAVVVEVFFEKPVALQKSEPALYEQLSRLFRVEPSTWT